MDCVQKPSVEACNFNQKNTEDAFFVSNTEVFCATIFVAQKKELYEVVTHLVI